jgi:uncharacterized protein (TIGR02996 family)
MANASPLLGFIDDAERHPDDATPLLVMADWLDYEEKLPHHAKKLRAEGWAKHYFRSFALQEMLFFTARSFLNEHEHAQDSIEWRMGLIGQTALIMEAMVAKDIYTDHRNNALAWTMAAIRKLQENIDPVDRIHAARQYIEEAHKEINYDLNSMLREHPGIAHAFGDTPAIPQHLLEEDDGICGRKTLREKWHALQEGLPQSLNSDRGSYEVAVTAMHYCYDILITHPAFLEDARRTARLIVEKAQGQSFGNARNQIAVLYPYFQDNLSSLPRKLAADVAFRRNFLASETPGEELASATLHTSPLNQVAGQGGPGM